MRIKLNEKGTSYAQVGILDPLEAIAYLADAHASIWAGRSVKVIYIDAQPRFRKEPLRWVRWVCDCTLVRLELIPQRLRAAVPGARDRVRDRYYNRLISLNKDIL